ncbi:MAG TPA: hypothetical protein VK894_14915 [Jiangellales bacterium]|nr:hypothetical protein [Jiangellales bacterium]
MRYARAVVLAAGLVMAASAAGVGGAAAKPLDKGTYEDHVTDVFEDFCDEPGLTVLYEAHVTGRFVGVARGKNGLAYYVGPERFTATYTNADDPSRFVTETGTTLFRDQKVTDNGDGTLTIQVLGTGNATAYGPDGKAIARNPGQVRFEILIDNGGTPEDPFDDEFIRFLRTVKESTGRNDDFCAAAVPLLQG